MADIADITFEMSDVDWIKTDLDRLQKVRPPKNKHEKRRCNVKTHDRDPEPDVGFSEVITNEEFLALEQLFNLVQGLEYGVHRSLVGFGAARKASLVNSICTDNMSTPRTREKFKTTNC